MRANKRQSNSRDRCKKIGRAWSSVLLSVGRPFIHQSKFSASPLSHKGPYAEGAILPFKVSHPKAISNWINLADEGDGLVVWRNQRAGTRDSTKG